MKFQLNHNCCNLTINIKYVTKTNSHSHKQLALSCKIYTLAEAVHCLTEPSTHSQG